MDTEVEDVLGDDFDGAAEAIWRGGGEGWRGGGKGLRLFQTDFKISV